MGKVENRLFMAELALPEVFSAPAGIEFKFDLVRISGGLAYVSGHGPIDGSKPVKLAIDLPIRDLGPDVHPDGRRIAFVSGNSRTREIRLLDGVLPSPGR